MDTAEILRKVRQIEIQTNKLVSETFAGEYLSTFKGQGIEFAEVRKYVPGDDVRSIDWNMTARTGEPFVKKFDETRELTLFIACDVSGSQQFGSGNKLKQEVAAELAALFAFSALHNSDKVGLLLFSDQVELFVPPKKGKKHILRLIRDLLAFEPKKTHTDIGVCLDTLLRVMKHQGIVILISDFLTSVESFSKPFKLAAKKFDLIPVIIRDNLEHKLPRLPLCMEVTDPETGDTRLLGLSTPDITEHLKDFWDKQIAELQHLFMPLKTSPIIVNTDGSTADPVIAFFRKRAKEGRR